MVTFKKEKRTTYAVGPISYLRMKEIMEDLWKSVPGARAREALRQELDVHSAFTWEKYLREGLDAHFNARTVLAGVETPVNPSNYWKRVNTYDGEIVCPTGGAIAIYSKNTFNLVTFKTKLPRFEVDDQTVFLGFEDGAAFASTGGAAFLFLRSGGVHRLGAWVGAGWTVEEIDLTDALPADFDTALHVYAIQILEPWVEFYIDNVLVAIGINSPNLAFPGIDYPPYGICRAPTGFSHRQTTLIEAADSPGVGLTLPLSPFYVRVNNAPLRPPRVFRLYEEATKNLFAGKTVSAGTLTSHPVPVFGYEGKTIHFRADTNSVTDGLIIEALTQAGNWREMDSVTYVADDDWFCTLGHEAVLIRRLYTPVSYPATVAEGEVVLR